MNFQKTGSKWIWDSVNTDTENQYVAFRQTFLGKDCQKLYISCDTGYVAYLNGKMIQFGQYLALPNQKFYDTIDIKDYLVPGENLLCILVYYQGVGTSCYSKGIPGIIYTIGKKEGFISNLSAKAARVSGFAEGKLPMISVQLGPSFAYDARKEQNWLSKDYDDGLWENAKCFDFAVFSPKTAQKRPVKKLEFTKKTPFSIAGHGTYSYQGGDSPAERISKCAMSAKMPVDFENPMTISDDSYLIIDMGEETAGYLNLDLKSAAGVEIDIAWGEHLTDGKVRAHISYRNFACTYVTKEGKNEFTNYFRRIAGRYLQLHFKGVKSPVKLMYAGLLVWEYPVKAKGKLILEDSLHQKIFNTAVHTLKCCMHEHYEDTPWREQALYAFDGRNQALFGYPVFENYSFALACIRLLGESIGEDGFVDICAPSDTELKIPAFSLLWLVFAAEYLEYSKDKKGAASLLSKIDFMIITLKKRIKNGLLPQPEGRLYWNFYDWEEGMTISHEVEKRSTDAVLNLYFCYALKKIAEMKKTLSVQYSEETELYYKLKKEINNTFFEQKEGIYRTFLEKKHKSQLVQSLAIVSGVAENPSLLRKKLLEDKTMVPVTLSASVFKYEALLMEKKYYKTVLSEVEKIWGGMLYRGATSFYETALGEKDFENAGSLCHGWSAVPIYVYNKIGLIR